MCNQVYETPQQVAKEQQDMDDFEKFMNEFGEEYAQWVDKIGGVNDSR